MQRTHFRATMSNKLFSSLVWGWGVRRLSKGLKPAWVGFQSIRKIMIKAERRPPSEHHNESPLQCISRLLQDNSLIKPACCDEGFSNDQIQNESLNEYDGYRPGTRWAWYGRWNLFPSRNDARLRSSP